MLLLNIKHCVSGHDIIQSDFFVAAFHWVTFPCPYAILEHTDISTFDDGNSHLKFRFWISIIKTIMNFHLTSKKRTMQYPREYFYQYLSVYYVCSHWDSCLYRVVFLTVPSNFQYQTRKRWAANQRFCSMKFSMFKRSSLVEQHFSF